MTFQYVVERAVCRFHDPALLPVLASIFLLADPAICKKLAENGVNIISSTEPTGDSPTEKLVETILAGFAQLDNDIRSERAKNGLRARFLSGLISGKPPIGYKFQAGFAVKDPEAWDKVKQAWDLMATGTKSTREMAEIMNEWGLREIHGKREFKLRAQTTCRIFRLKSRIPATACCAVAT